MIKPLFRIILAGIIGIQYCAAAGASVLRLDAPKVFEESVTHNLNLSNQMGQIELAIGELFEDDGPASGKSYQKPENREQITSDTWIKKDLIIPNPQAQAAYLVVLSDKPVEAIINGVALHFATNQSGRPLHQKYAFDPKVLQPGRNEIILRNTGNVMIARDDEFALGSLTRTKSPGRSAKSTDGGKTWDYKHLGPDGKLAGEYGVRVFLEHYLSQGSLTLPVMDAGNLEGKPVPGLVTQMGPIEINVEGETGPSGGIRVRARAGDTFVPTEAHWTDWQVLGETNGVLQSPRGRYVQVAVDLTSRDPLQSPRLRSIRVEASSTGPQDWTDRVRVLEEHNEEIVRTSIPFEYEPLDQPRLKKFREEYKLDDVVNGATNEMELMLRLAQWACNYWDWPNHIGECYPPWDALEILKPYGDGKPTGGFCLQYNLVFLQACESFGFVGRAVSISPGAMYERLKGGGHEIVEIWSNEWKKWVYADGALAWYVVDEKTGVPLSIWEMRQHQLPTLRGEPVVPVRVVAAERTRNKQFPWKGIAAPDPSNWYLELRMIPRSNFLQAKSPLPLSQGTDEWSWTGHYVWTDSEAPAGLLFGNRVTKREDFQWTLNQAHYVVEPDKSPGVFRVHLDTETPSFDTFLAEIDGGEKKCVASGFTWALHSGKNQLRVLPRNVAGREGIPSWITVEYAN